MLIHEEGTVLDKKAINKRRVAFIAKVIDSEEGRLWIAGQGPKPDWVDNWAPPRHPGAYARYPKDPRSVAWQIKRGSSPPDIIEEESMNKEIRQRDTVKSDSLQTIDPKEFREKGYLQELNRQFLHPLGLAIEIVIEDDGSEHFGRIWDYRSDAEGIYFSDGTASDEKAAFIQKEFFQRSGPRVKQLGYVIQPIIEEGGDMIEEDMQANETIDPPVGICSAGTFSKRLEQLINEFSMENCSDTPDFILAEYIEDCLNAYNTATSHREAWYGREPETDLVPLQDDGILEETGDEEVLIVKVGNNERPASPADLESVRKAMSQICEDGASTLVTHHAMKFEVVKKSNFKNVQVQPSPENDVANPPTPVSDSGSL